MHRFRPLRFVLLTLTAFVSTPVLAQEGVLQGTLGNGLRVVIVRDALAPMVASRLVYQAGSAEASAEFPGTAHALEHMMFRGTSTMNTAQLSRIGEAVGGLWNAFTSPDHTQYVFDIAPADLGVVLHLEADRMRNLALDPAQWARERGAIEQEISRNRSSSQFRAREQEMAAIYRNTPYGWLPLGTRQSFDATNVGRLRAFYQAWYAPNNAILFIVGDVDPAAALKLVERNFGSIPARALPQRPTAANASFIPETLTAPTDSAVGRMTIGWRLPGLRSEDAAALSIMADAISNSRGKLAALGIDGKALGASFSYWGYRDGAAAVAETAYPRNADPAPYLAELKRVLADYRAHGVPADLVEAAKRAHLKEAAFARNSIGGLATVWINAVVNWGFADPDALARAYAAVTPARINALAARYLDVDHAVIQTWIPTGRIAATSDRGFGGAETFGDKMPGDVALPGWAQSVLTLPPQPHWPVAEHVYTLANGLRLIVRPEHQSHTILMFGRIHTNPALEEPSGKEGVASLAAQLFAYGTTARGRIATAQVIDDLGSSVWFGPHFGIEALTADFQPALELLADTELHPAFREADLAARRAKLAAARQGIMHTPIYAYGRAILTATLPRGDPDLREATPATIGSLTRDDVMAFFLNAYRPDMTAIEVIGDIEPEMAKRLIEAAFGAWHGRGPRPDVILPPIPDAPRAAIQMDGEGRTQDQVELYQPVSLRRGQADTVSFGIGNDLLSRGFASRLYQALRVKTGYVYGVTSIAGTSQTRGGFTIDFGADPDKVPQAEKLTMSILRDMRTHPVSAIELTSAKAGYLRVKPFATASLAGIARLDLTMLTEGLPLDQPNRDTSTVAATTPAQIERLFAREIDPARISDFIYGPRPPAMP